MGRRFPEGKVFFEHQCAAISNAFAIEQRDVTAKNAPGDAKQRSRFAELHFNPHAGQQAPVCFDERAAR